MSAFALFRITLNQIISFNEASINGKQSKKAYINIVAIDEVPVYQTSKIVNSKTIVVNYYTVEDDLGYYDIVALDETKIADLSVQIENWNTGNCEGDTYYLVGTTRRSDNDILIAYEKGYDFSLEEITSYFGTLYLDASTSSASFWTVMPVIGILIALALFIGRIALSVKIIADRLKREKELKLLLRDARLSQIVDKDIHNASKAINYINHHFFGEGCIVVETGFIPYSIIQQVSCSLIDSGASVGKYCTKIIDRYQRVCFITINEQDIDSCITLLKEKNPDIIIA